MNAPALTMLVALTLPATGTIEERCDLIEHNVVLHGDGSECLAQLIFDDVECVRDWRMVKRTGTPRYDWQRKCWIVRWIEEGVVREVRADRYRTVIDFYDREIDAREDWPADNRRKLLVPVGNE